MGANTRSYNIKKIQGLFTLICKKDVVCRLDEVFGKGRVVEADTTLKREIGRMRWGRYICEEIYKESYESLSREKAIHFSFLRFVKEIGSSDSIYGFSGGKTQVYKGNKPDLNFQGLTVPFGKKVWKECFDGTCCGKKIEWYTEKIIIIKNKNKFSSKEALDNEALLNRRSNSLGKPPIFYFFD